MSADLGAPLCTVQGVRCLEIDCWDGKDGEPIVTHGHTLCTKVPFAAVVKAIGASAFETCDSPVILSLEMHCSTQQQERIAALLREYLTPALIEPAEFARTIGSAWTATALVTLRRRTDS